MSKGMVEASYRPRKKKLAIGCFQGTPSAQFQAKCENALLKDGSAGTASAWSCWSPERTGIFIFKTNITGQSAELQTRSNKYTVLKLYHTESYFLLLFHVMLRCCYIVQITTYLFFVSSFYFDVTVILLCIRRCTTPLCNAFGPSWYS